MMPRPDCRVTNQRVQLERLRPTCRARWGPSASASRRDT
jgi:hypothetical protein